MALGIVLERILMLIPRKSDGKFLHGAKKEFCEKLGLPPNTVTEWISGRSHSYFRYVYQIADAYGVNVEWLKGETDEKSPPQNQGGQMTPEERARQERLQLLVTLFENLTPAEQERFLGRLEGIALSREGRDNPLQS